MFLYRYIHFIVFGLSTVLGIAISAHFTFGPGRTPSSKEVINPNLWELEFGRTKKIWGVYELTNENMAGSNITNPTHAIVEKNELHLFRERLGEGLTTEVVHLKLELQKIDKENLVATIGDKERQTLQSFTGGRDVEVLKCHKKWKTLECQAELRPAFGPVFSE